MEEMAKQPVVLNKLVYGIRGLNLSKDARNMKMPGGFKLTDGLVPLRERFVPSMRLITLVGRLIFLFAKLIFFYPGTP